MTENEAKSLIEWFKVRKGKTLKLNDKGIDYVVQALEEVQAYRKIGLTPELIEAMQGHNIALINDLGEYQQIGTIEEFKAYKQGSCTNDCEHYDSTAEYVRNKAIDEFTHQLKENLNQEFPRNYESTRPYFSLENARLLVDEIAGQLKAGGIDG